jgi:hypothetical protein
MEITDSQRAVLIKSWLPPCFWPSKRDEAVRFAYEGPRATLAPGMAEPFIRASFHAGLFGRPKSPLTPGVIQS